MTNDQRCSRCGGATGGHASGSITQWVKKCSCVAIESEDSSAEEVQICASCQRRIGEGRHGSFTQWIFRGDICSCTHPKPMTVRQAPGNASDARIVETPESEKEDKEELELDPRRFPLDRYKPIALLGTGASGSVYLGVDRLLLKKVAIKTMSGYPTEEQLVAFQREAKATSALNHPGIIRINDFGVTASTLPFMVMEYFQGQSLSDFLESRGPLPENKAFLVFSQVCDALSEAHSQGIFHRDIKLSNILVGDIDSHVPQVRLIDFGIGLIKGVNQGKITAQGLTLVGTPEYMSPDQANGFPYDERSEVYSIGCALFEALTGKTPFTGESALDIINRHACAPVPALSSVRGDLDFSDEAESIVAICLAKRPHQRFSSARELADQLRVDLASVTAAESALYTQVTKAPRRTNVPVRALVVMCAILIAVPLLMMIIRMSRKPADISIRPIEYFSLPNEGDMAESEEVSGFNTATIGGVQFLVANHEFVDEDLKNLKPDQKRFLGVYLIGKQITAASLRSLSSTATKKLWLSLTPISQECLHEISKAASLTDVYLGDIDLTHLDISVLSQLPNLRSLDLANSRITGETLLALSSLKRLEKISLLGVSGITSSGLARLSDLPELTSLDLSFTHLDDNGIASLLKMKKLHALRLISAEIEDGDLTQISKMPLTELNLDKNRISERGISSLASMLSLRRLSLLDCLGLKPEILQPLQIKLRECKITVSSTKKLSQS